MSETDANYWLTRTELLLGAEKAASLADARVLVVGLGGVGAYAAEMICRAGVGHMTIVDGDCVEISNLNRQLVALHSTLGESKAAVMEARLLDINPRLKLKALHLFLRDELTAEVLDSDRFDYVVDAIDSLSPKLNLLLKCLERNIPVISSMGSGGKLDPAKIEVADISRSYNCKLAKALRKRLHRRGISKGIQVVFSPEDVPEDAIDADNDGDEEGHFRSTVGTIAYMPAIFGCVCASAVIRGLLEKPEK